jgi:hypothetical protein
MNLISGCKKRGNVGLDVIVIIVVIVAFVLIGVFCKYVLTGLNDDIQTDTSMSNQSKQIASTMNANFNNFYDGLFIIMFVLLWVLLLVSAHFSENHPLFFVVMIFIMVFVFIIAMVLGNIYEEIISEDGLSVYSLGFTFAHWVMTHFLLTVIVIGTSVMIVMFGKNYGQA